MKTKRLLAVVLAAMLLLALAVPSLADETAAPQADPTAAPAATTAPADPTADPEDDPATEPEDDPAPAVAPVPMTSAEATAAAGKVVFRVLTDKVVEASGTALITFEVLNGGSADIALMDVVPVYTSSSIVSGIFLAADLGGGVLPAGNKLASALTVSINAAKNATSDNKGYAVTVDCYYHAVSSETAQKVSDTVNIVKTSPRVASSDGPVSTGSKPKLIIESYSLSSARVFAGDEFTLTMVIRNTSESRDVKNLTVTVEDSTNSIRPGNNGSNTFYIGKIADEDSHTLTVTLTTEPAMEAGTYTLAVGFDYETSSHVEYTGSETISVPVAQRLRVSLNEPTIYGDYHALGDRISMFFSLNNLGKATIYNCTVSVEGDGLAMDESYFGGNIGPGTTMSADFDVISSVGGEIAGAILVTYEDVYGEVTEERVPFTVFVEEPAPYDPGMTDPMYPDYPIDEPVGGAGFIGSIWMWVVIAVVGAGVIVLIILLVKRKKARRRELEDV